MFISSTERVATFYTTECMRVGGSSACAMFLLRCALANGKQCTVCRYLSGCAPIDVCFIDLIVPMLKTSTSRIETCAQLHYMQITPTLLLHTLLALYRARRRWRARYVASSSSRGEAWRRRSSSFCRVVVAFTSRARCATDWIWVCRGGMDSTAARQHDSTHM